MEFRLNDGFMRTASVLAFRRTRTSLGTKPVLTTFEAIFEKIAATKAIFNLGFWPETLPNWVAIASGRHQGERASKGASIGTSIVWVESKLNSRRSKTWSPWFATSEMRVLRGNGSFSGPGFFRIFSRLPQESEESALSIDVRHAPLFRHRLFASGKCLWLESRSLWKSIS